jgi:HAD superfamily hydrolase (TIGR01458 family)
MIARGRRGRQRRFVITARARVDRRMSSPARGDLISGAASAARPLIRQPDSCSFPGRAAGLAGILRRMPAALGAIDALLLDLDGVLYVEDEPVPGAREAVAELRERGLALRFVTNTTARPRRRILERLERLGFALDPAELSTPAALAVRHCRDRGHTRVALVMNEDVKEDFAELEEVDRGADAVVVGDLGSAFGYDVLNRAFRQLMDGAELIALQKNRFWMTPDGLSLDVGPFVAALEYAARRDALVVGKPARAFFATILAGIPAEPGAAAMVGDDVESDIGGAQGAGLAGVLVRTGKYRDDAVRASGVQPTAVVDSIADVPDLIAGAA